MNIKRFEYLHDFLIYKKGFLDREHISLNFHICIITLKISILALLDLAFLGLKNPGLIHPPSMTFDREVRKFGTQVVLNKSN